MNMYEEEANDTNLLSVFKEKIEAMELVPAVCSMQNGSLQMWMNAFQSGKDVQLNLSTSENGQIQITLVEPTENHQVTELDNNVSSDKFTSSLESFSNNSEEKLENTEDATKSVEWGLFRQDKGSVIARPISDVMNNIQDKKLSEESPFLDVVDTPFPHQSDDLFPGSSGSFALNDSVNTQQEKKEVLSNSETGSVINPECESKGQSTIIVSVATNHLSREEDSKLAPPDSRPTPADPNIFPCVRSEWYVKPPKVGLACLIDEDCDVNTIAVACDLRHYLRHHSISLTVFSKNYLQRSQGTLSDLLNHPKPWNGLSTRGKSIYLKLMQFLNAENLLEIVNELKKLNATRPGPSTSILPPEIMDSLQKGEMPSHQIIASVATQLNLNQHHLRSYCRTHMGAADVVVELEIDSDDAYKEDSTTASAFKTSDASEETMEASKCKKSRTMRSGFTPRYVDKQICPVHGCGYILSNKISLENHLLLHSGTRSYKCGKCDKRFTTPSNLRAHERRHSNRNRTLSKRARKAALLRNKELQSRTINKSEDESGSFNEEIMNEVSSEESNHNINSNDLSVAESRDTNSTLKVKQFSKVALASSTNSKIQYVCGVCVDSFSSKQLLHDHVTSCHSSAKMRDQDRQFTCHLCSNLYRTMASLEAHLRTHEGERAYRCKVCDKRFLTMTNCRRHMKTHTGEKPFKCPKCPSRFTEASSVTTHMRIHTGERPFACETCGKTFSQQGPLIAHRLLHTGLRPYLCQTCGRSFRQKTNLRAHEERHRGIRPYSCTECSHAFPSKIELQRHVLQHTGDRPYICEICDQSFTRLQYLKQHVVKAHNLSLCKEQSQVIDPGNNSLLSLKTVKGDRTEGVFVENGTDYASSVLQVLSNTICCIAPLSPSNAGTTLDQPLQHISSVLANDTDPTLSASNVSASFSINSNESVPVTILMNRGLVFSGSQDMESTIMDTNQSETNDPSLCIVSKIPLPDQDVASCSNVVTDGSDPNMQSVIVAPEECDQLEEGARYVVVSVTDGDSPISNNPNQENTLNSSV